MRSEPGARRESMRIACIEHVCYSRLNSLGNCYRGPRLWGEGLRMQTMWRLDCGQACAERVDALEGAVLLLRRVPLRVQCCAVQGKA